MLRILFALTLLAAVAVGQSAKSSYRSAMRKRGDAKRDFAAQEAAKYEDAAEGVCHLYVGLLWQYAEKWDKAIEAFEGYLAGAKPTAKSRPRAMLEIANSHLGARRYAPAAEAARKFLSAHKGHAHASRVRYALGRALRAQDRLPDALKAFQAGDNAGHKMCKYEVADCLLQLGRYDEIKDVAAETTTDSGRWKTLLAALPNMNKAMPKSLRVDFWAGSRALGLGEIKQKPTLWSFWTMKVGNMLNPIHAMTNGIATRFAGKAHVFGPTVYVRFNPIDMKSIPDMEKSVEQDYVEGWKSQYELRYDLVIMPDNTLHNMCGVDPAYPALPAFSVTDTKGRLRYVRVGPEAASTEAVESMLRRLLKE